MNTGPTGHVRNFLTAAPQGLTGTVAASLAPLEATPEEREVVFGLVHQDELGMSMMNPWHVELLRQHRLLALIEQRTVGYNLGYVRALRRENPARYAQVMGVGHNMGPVLPQASRPLEVPVSNDHDASDIASDVYRVGESRCAQESCTVESTSATTGLQRCAVRPVCHIALSCDRPHVARP